MDVFSSHGRTDSHGERPSVVVIGGGLAGIAAAVNLSSQGVPTTLVETRKRLGGRATSFVDPATGQALDNCQHVLMGCCTNLMDLYRRLGVAKQIHWHHRLFFADQHGQVDLLEADDLPAPLHMTRSLLSFKLLSVSEKVAIVRGMLAILRLGRSARERLEGISFDRWLLDHHQPTGAIRKFWSVIVVSALNERLETVDASYAVQVFQDGFLANEHAYVVGLPAVPLSQLYDSAHRVITEAGGRVCLASAAESFDFDGKRIRALCLTDGRQLTADAFIAAVPYDRLARLCGSAMGQQDPRLQVLDQFRASPIIGIHLWFGTPLDRPLMRLPHLILTEGPLQWLFNKGYDDHLDGQHLHGVISAAHDLIDAPAQEILDLAVAQIRHLFNRSPDATNVPLIHGRVIKEKKATFSASPGVHPLRPTTRGKIDNLYLAGDWCQTGWPATMEGATRSGYLAAAAVCRDRGVLHGQDTDACSKPLVADLPVRPLCRLCLSRV